MPQAPVMKRSGTDEDWSDERLIKECIAGNEEAWRTLINRYKNLVFSIPRKLGFSLNDSNEIFQQVCLQLVSSLPTFREPKTLPAWIIKVTSHRCFQMAKRMKSVDPAIYKGDIPDSEPLPDRLLDQLKQEQILRDAMSQLPPRCRELIRMLFFEMPPVPYEEVARKLGLATGSVGFIRMRCLKRLREKMERKGFA